MVIEQMFDVKWLPARSVAVREHVAGSVLPRFVEG
jgi:hypothetical protein